MMENVLLASKGMKFLEEFVFYLKLTQIRLLIKAVNNGTGTIKFACNVLLDLWWGKIVVYLFLINVEHLMMMESVLLAIKAINYQILENVSSQE